jgi:hypothetical protein
MFFTTIILLDSAAYDIEAATASPKVAGAAFDVKKPSLQATGARKACAAAVGRQRSDFARNATWLSSQGVAIHVSLRHLAVIRPSLTAHSPLDGAIPKSQNKRCTTRLGLAR